MLSERLKTSHSAMDMSAVDNGNNVVRFVLFCLALH